MSKNNKTTDFSKGLGQLLRSLRKQHGLTQTELAAKLSINYRHYQDIEAGRTDVRIGTVSHIVSLYHVDLIQLMTLTTNPDLWKQISGGVNYSPAGIAEINREGTITFANNTFHEQLSYTPSEVIGRSIFDMFANSHRSDAQDWFHRAIDNTPEPKIKRCIPMRKKDGADQELHLMWNYIRGVRDHLTGMACIFIKPEALN